MVIYLAFITAVGGYQRVTCRCVPIVHNFDLRRTDSSTAAQRFFGRTFPELFPWLMEQMGDLPSPRKPRKSLNLTTVT